jgi:hypothetical protein
MWKDGPVDCATLFHTRVTKFMNDIILLDVGALGHVKDYLIRYKLQHRGLLHAYVILWMSLWIEEDDDVELVTNEITAIALAVYDEGKKEFIESMDDLQKILFKMVTRKLLHSSSKHYYRKYKYGECKYSFPFSIHENNKAEFNARNTRCEYHRPRYIDRNVVPYHATYSLLGGKWMRPQYNEPLSVLTVLISNAFYFSIRD